MTATLESTDLGARYAGDPSPALVRAEVVDDGHVSPLAPPDGASLTATLTGPARQLAATYTAQLDPDDTAVVELKATGAVDLETAGVYVIDLHLEDATLATGFLVAEARSGWLTLAEARRLWRDAPTNDATLYLFLAATLEQFADAGVNLDAPVGPSRQLAQIMHATALWDAARDTADDGALAPDGYVIPRARIPLGRDIRRALVLKGALV